VSLGFVPQSPTVDSSSPEHTLAQAISEAAYYRAEGRGFAPGHELEDWVEAEQQVTAAYRDARDQHH